MRISLRVDPKQITADILNTSRARINADLHRIADGVRRDLLSMIDGLLKGSPTYTSLLNGTLRAEFGLENPDIALHDILETLKRSVNVSVVPVRNNGQSLSGSINISLIRSGFEDILSLSSASYQGKNFPVPWLDWLLLQGDRVIVAGYHITYNLSEAQQRASLTGVAIMEKGGGWRVPSNFSGIESDNWITRTFDPDKVSDLISTIVANNFKKVMRT